MFASTVAADAAFTSLSKAWWASLSATVLFLPLALALVVSSVLMLTSADACACSVALFLRVFKAASSSCCQQHVPVREQQRSVRDDAYSSGGLLA